MIAAQETLFHVVFEPGGTPLNQAHYEGVAAGTEDAHGVIYKNEAGRAAGALVFMPHSEGRRTLSKPEMKTVVDMALQAARREQIVMQDAEYLSLLLEEDVLAFLTA